MSTNAYFLTSLTGGGTGALDAIDGAGLADGDAAIVIDGTTGITYIYTLDSASGATEDSPSVISPDTNAGTKRWLIQEGVEEKAYCELLATTAQSVPTSTSTVLTWTDAEEVSDSLGMHSGTTNPSRITIQRAGVYAIFGSNRWAVNTTGLRELLILKNGVTRVVGVINQPESSAGHCSQSVSASLVLAVSDYVELQAYQASGVVLNAGVTQFPYFSAVRIKA